MFDDEKIKLIRKMPEGDTIIGIWIQLLIQAGKTNMNGFIMLAQNVPYSLEMLATIFDRELPILRFAIKTLSDMGMVTLQEDFLLISNFDKYQNTFGLEKIREQNRLRVAKFRENQKNVTLQVTQCNATDNRIKIIDKRNNNKVDIYDLFKEVFPNDNVEFGKAWGEWVEYRKQIKKKLTPLSAKKQLEFLKGQPDPIKCINQSIQNQWQGLFEVKDGTAKNNTSKGSVKSRTDYRFDPAKAEQRLKQLEEQYGK